MCPRTQPALVLCVANALFVASAHALVIHDKNGKAVEPTPAADSADLVPTGKGWGQKSKESSQANGSSSANPFLPNASGEMGWGQPVGNAKGGNHSGGGKSGGGKSGGSSLACDQDGINYHGGSIITGTTNVYYIWYGGWNFSSGSTDSSTKTILDHLASSVGASPYYDINTTYCDGNGNSVTPSVALSGNTTDNYSQGTALSDSGVQAVVASAISSGALPKDDNGVYFVLTSADVDETSGFCTRYCGWHTYQTLIDGTNIKYAFVGDPQQCPSACEAQATSPNNNPGADGMASVIAHELEESATDPNLGAWYDHRGYENADKCAWNFGATYTAANGSLANMNLNGSDYLIQQNWVNAVNSTTGSKGYCSLSY